MVRLPCTSPATASRPRRNGRAIHPIQLSPNSTASVALCDATAKAIRANSEHFSIVDVRSPWTTRMKNDSTASPAKISVSSVVTSHGSAVERTSTRLIASSRSGRAMPSTRSVSCRIHSVASAWIPRLIQNAEFSPKWRYRPNTVERLGTR